MPAQFELINKEHIGRGQIKAAVFDFDGTFSTLRCGWEKVMRPLMLEMISGAPADEASAELQKEVDDYIDQSTGIQTVYQMQWLKERVEAEGRGAADRDEWWYKAEYNRRLMEQVSVRLDRLEKGLDKPETYLVKGAVDFLLALKQAGVEIFLASGTDHKDVVREAGALGVDKYFTQIKGAPEHMAACSKEAVIRMILEEKGLAGEQLLLVGDGKVEIALGREVGAYTLGAATDEEKLYGVNPVKRERLLKAGADVLIGDFTEYNSIMSWLGFEKEFKPATKDFVQAFFERHESWCGLRPVLERGIAMWRDTYAAGGKILLCGNGGSCSDSDHITGELLKGFLLKRPVAQDIKDAFAALWGEEGCEIAGKLQQGLPAISLTNHGAGISAFANDVDPELVYAQQVLAYGKAGDVLVGISTSGGASNVDAAMKTAKALGLKTMGLTGRDGGKLKATSDICIIAPERETYLIQECHLCFYHLLCAGCEYELFDK